MSSQIDQFILKSHVHYKVSKVLEARKLVIMSTEIRLASYVVVACDATKDRNEQEVKVVVDHLKSRGDILSSSDSLVVLGALHKVPHPSKCIYSERTFQCA